MFSHGLQAHVSLTTTLVEAESLHSLIGAYTIILDWIKEGRYNTQPSFDNPKKNREHKNQIIKLFRTDLERSFGTSGHTKAETIWQKAWDEHGSGWIEVLGEYTELVNLIR